MTEEYQERVSHIKSFMDGDGWFISHECQCGGIHRIEFVKGEMAGVVVKVYPGKKRFKSTRRGRKIWEDNIDNLETFVNGLVA